MTDHAELDAIIAACVRDMGGDWTSADMVHRMARSRLGFAVTDPQAPSLALIARRLPKIPGLERTVYDGRWTYRPLREKAA